MSKSSGSKAGLDYIVEKHEKGGHIVTWKGAQYLRDENGIRWYHWPSCTEVERNLPLSQRWREYNIKQRYQPASYKPKAKGNPSRCIFCHEDAGGFSAHCFKCGAVVHLECTKEAGNKCLTPGCDSK